MRDGGARGNSMSESALPWFAVRVKSRHEKSVAQHFTTKNIQSFLPLYKSKQRWADRVKYLDLPLFPGYVFCRMNPHIRVPVLSTLGVLDIVGGRNGNATVDDAEICAIQKLAAAHLDCEPSAWIATGEHVRIDHGPLAGVEGIVVNTKSGARLVLSITLLQRSVLVEIDRESATSLRQFPFLNSRTA